MTEHDDGAGWKTSSRGDAAWKETREAIASRNADARKQGRERRETYEETRAEVRRVAEARQRAQMLKRARP